jgi:hypothetical protein
MENIDNVEPYSAEWDRQTGEQIRKNAEKRDAIGKTYAEHIREMVDNAGTEDGYEEIFPSVLEICYRSGWESPSDFFNSEPSPAEVYLLLCTGGPAVRIRAEVEDNGSFVNPVLEVSDWFVGWGEYSEPGLPEYLQTFCSFFEF